MKFNKNWSKVKQFQWLLERQPRARGVPGYYKDGKLIQGYFWLPMLGSEGVNDIEGIDRGHFDGFWIQHCDAVAAAKRFQDKTREWLEKNVDSSE